MTPALFGSATWMGIGMALGIAGGWGALGLLIAPFAGFILRKHAQRYVSAPPREYLNVRQGGEP